VNVRRILYETLSVLILCGLLEIFAGTTLSGMESFLESLPGLIIMLPPMLDLRGDINGSFAARLGSGIHLGIIDSKHRDEIIENLKAALLMSIVVPAVIAILSFLVCRLFSLPSIGLFELMFIAVCTGLTSGVILSILSIALTYSASRIGLDPDNITIPILSTLGDFIVILALFLFTAVIA
jgi:mgtE-like transporter